MEARLRRASFGELSSSAGSSTNSLKAAAAASAAGGRSKHGAGTKVGSAARRGHHHGSDNGSGWGAEYTSESGGSSKAPSSAGGRGEAGAAEAVQICFDFTKGVCSRGESCRFSHDIATIVTVNSQERGICFDFVRGQCNRGLLCRFSHDLSNLAQHQPGQQGHGQLGGAHARIAPQPKTGAICYDYVKARTPTIYEMLRVLCVYVLGVCTVRAREVVVVFMKRMGLCSPSNLPLPWPLPHVSSLLILSQGACSRGQDCRYSHDINTIATNFRAAPPPGTTEICHDFTRGRCSRGVNCRYSHAPAGAPAGWPNGGSGWVAAASPSNSNVAAAVLSAQQQQQQASKQNGIGFSAPVRLDAQMQQRPPSTAMPGSRYADVLGSRSQLSAPPPPPSRPSQGQPAVPSFAQQQGYPTQAGTAAGPPAASRLLDPTAAHLGFTGYRNGVNSDSMQQQANSLDGFGMAQSPGNPRNMTQTAVCGPMIEMPQHQQIRSNADRLTHTGLNGSVGPAGLIQGQHGPPPAPPGHAVPPHFQQSRPPPPPPRPQQHPPQPQQQQPPPPHDSIGWQNDQVVARLDKPNGMSQGPPLSDVDFASAARMALQAPAPGSLPRQYMANSGMPSPTNAQAVPTGWSTGHQLNNGMNQNTLGQLRQIWGRSS